MKSTFEIFSRNFGTDILAREAKGFFKLNEGIIIEKKKGTSHKQEAGHM